MVLEMIGFFFILSVTFQISYNEILLSQSLNHFFIEGGAEGRERENLKQASLMEPNAGLDLTTLRS